MKALILAGGFGKRLRPYTEQKPKPLIEVAGKPILVWQIEWLKSLGIDTVVLAVGYLKEKVVEEIGSGRKYGVKAIYVVEEEPLGTGGAIKNAEAALMGEEKFLVMNGDILTNINALKLCESLGDAIASIALVPLPSPYGIVVTDENSYVTEFKEKPFIKDYWINAGVYCFTPEIFNYLPVSGDIEKITFPKLAKERRLKSVKFSDVFWKSVDTYKDIEEADRLLREQSIF